MFTRTPVFKITNQDGSPAGYQMGQIRNPVRGAKKAFQRGVAETTGRPISGKQAQRLRKKLARWRKQGRD